MKRRHFLSLTTLLAAVSSKALARSGPKAAIVIGVDQSRGMPPLTAAASGAKQVAEWLTGEGFKPVVLLTDEGEPKKPVMLQQVKDAVRTLVEPGNLQQLVIYFAGHGFRFSRTEFWMLSKAPDEVGEAISQTETQYDSRQFGIPHVVIISDTCRTSVDSARISQVQGGTIFPNAFNFGSTDVTTDVDVFMATKADGKAYEILASQGAQQYEGLYTTTLLEVFKHGEEKWADIVNGIKVVPDYKLKDYLLDQVPKRLAKQNFRHKQVPDAQVTSRDGYIGRYLPAVVASEGEVIRLAREVTIQDVARQRLKGLGLETQVAAQTSSGPSPAEIFRHEQAAEFDAAVNNIVVSRGLSDRIGAQCGFAISGKRLSHVVSPPDVPAKFSNGGDRFERAAFVEINLGWRNSTSICLEFEDGSGTIVGAIKNFIGTVVVEEDGVSNVSYVPAKSNVHTYAEYQAERQRLESLRAVVATSANYGVFRIEAPRGEQRERVAENIADRIRMLKAIDPTLGLYAAYAYFQAGLSEKVESVRLYLSYSIDGAQLFDVAMLAGTLKGEKREKWLVPFVPMLTQGWSLLRVCGVKLTPEIASMRRYIKESLWLTLDKEGVAIAKNVIRSGKVR